MKISYLFICMLDFYYLFEMHVFYNLIVPFYGRLLVKPRLILTFIVLKASLNSTKLTYLDFGTSNLYFFRLKWTGILKGRKSRHRWSFFILILNKLFECWGEFNISFTYDSGFALFGRHYQSTANNSF